MGTYEDIAEQVLRRAKQPLSVPEIVERARAGSFGDLIRGATPQKTFHARMSTEIQKNGDQSKFVRVGRGIFGLREFVPKDKILTPDEPPPLLTGLGSLKESELLKTSRQETRDVNEEVILVESTLVDQLDFVGFKRMSNSDLASFFNDAKSRIETRAQAELLGDYRQLIAYTVIRGPDKVLSYSRGAPGEQDDLLKGKRAVGVGGHANASDLSMFRDPGDVSGLIAALRSCASREILEELEIEDRWLSNEAAHAETSDRLNVVGLINDESSEMGLKRLAVVFEFEAPQTPAWNSVESAESEIRSVAWISPYRDGLNLNEFEYWSVLYFENRFAAVVRQAQEFSITDLERLQSADSYCVLGGIGSGKSLASDLLSKRLGGSIVNSGRVLSEILELKPVPQTDRVTFQNAAEKYMSKPEAAQSFAAAMVEKANKQDAPVIFDGVRNRSTLLALMDLNPTMGIIYISAPPHIAHELYNLRGRDNGIYLTAKDFMSLRRNPTEFEVQFLARYAHAHIYNWLGVEEYTERMEQLISIMENSN